MDMDFLNTSRCANTQSKLRSRDRRLRDPRGCPTTQCWLSLGEEAGVAKACVGVDPVLTVALIPPSVAEPTAKLPDGGRINVADAHRDFRVPNLLQCAHVHSQVARKELQHLIAIHPFHREVATGHVNFEGDRVGDFDFRVHAQRDGRLDFEPNLRTLHIRADLDFILFVRLLGIRGIQ